MNEAKAKLAFALDVPDSLHALKLVEQLKDSVGCFKVGLELFISEGPDILKQIQKIAQNVPIFLDLKLHDIPATLTRALKSAAKHKVKYITIHLEEGEALRKIPNEVLESGINVIAVTVLTSISKDDLDNYNLSRHGTWGNTIKLIEDSLKKDIESKNLPNKTQLYQERLLRLIAYRANQAKLAGCSGVVCSGNEVRFIKDLYGHNLKVIVPGIRPEWSVMKNDDQSRITTPGEAIAAGADLIVVGRPIRDAGDPKAAAERIVEEMTRALQSQS